MKIRILHVLYSFDTGGLENGLVNLINHLPEERFFHVVCILSQGKGSEGRLLKNNVIFYQLKKREGNDLTVPFKIAAIIRREKINLVHSRNWVSLMEGVAGSALGGFIPVIHSEHGKELDDLEHNGKLRHLAKKLCFHLVGRVITVSRSLGEELVQKKQCPARKIVPIINGVDCDRFGADKARIGALARKSYGIPAAKFVIGSVGRLAKVKNYQLMIELCRCLDERFVFVLVGDGPERADLERAVRDQGVAGRFLLLGEITDVSTVLCCFDLFLNTSEYEGISNTILEAMASGVPVVANDVGGNRELIREGSNGFLIPNNDKAAFLGRILALSSDPELFRAMGDCSRLLAQKEFSLLKMINSYQDEYLRCLTGSGI